MGARGEDGSRFSRGSGRDKPAPTKEWLGFSGALFLGGGEEGGREFFVEGEEVFDALAVVVEGLRAIAEVDGAVEFGVGFDERGRHGQRIVEVGEGGIGKFFAGVDSRISESHLLVSFAGASLGNVTSPSVNSMRSTPCSLTH